MGLISRDSSRTYRNYKWHRKLSASTLCSKSETRSSPETRSIGLRESPTHHGDDQRVSIVPSDDDTVDKLAPRYRLRYQQRYPTHLPRPDGFQEVSRSQLDELNCLMMSNRAWACEIASGVSSKKRTAIIERAAALNVHVTNSKA